MNVVICEGTVLKGQDVNMRSRIFSMNIFSNVNTVEHVEQYMGHYQKSVDLLSWKLKAQYIKYNVGYTSCLY